MATGHHRLLNIHSAHEQLSDGSAITVAGDPAKADRLADHHGLKVIAGSSGPFRLSRSQRIEVSSLLPLV